MTYGLVPLDQQTNKREAMEQVKKIRETSNAEGKSTIEFFEWTHQRQFVF